MNKKYNAPQTNSKSFKSYLFWGIIIAVTVFFIVFIIVRFVNARSVNSYDSLIQLEGNQILEVEEQTETYLVFVYSSKQEKEAEDDEFDELMYKYITFAKKNKDVKAVYNIYGFDIDKPENKKVIITDTGEKKIKINGVESFDDLLIYSKDVPILLVISGNVVDDYKDSDNSISDYLQAIIEANKWLFFLDKDVKK